MSSPESALETLARASVDCARAEITEFYAVLVQIAVSIEAGDLEAARHWVGVSIGRIAAIYGLIYLELPPWTPPSLRPKLDKGVAALRREIGRLNQVRQHERRERLELKSGRPPARAN